VIKSSTCGKCGALGGTRTPNLLIRSYRRVTPYVRNQRHVPCSRPNRANLVRTLMAAHDGPGAPRLLYSTAVLIPLLAKSVQIAA
jgi:hypothetical protein